MIFIFHGDNVKASRLSLNQALQRFKNSDILRLNQKEIEIGLINNFLNSPSLINLKKILVLSNFFSLHPSTRTKIAAILKNHPPDCQVVIWHNKTLTATQLKTFPSARTQCFPLSKILFTCLSAIKPKNVQILIPLYQQLLQKEPYDLFLYLLKNNLRKQLQTYSALNKNKLKNTYLHLIELDYKNKTGKLSISKEITLERIIINLLQ